MTDQEKELFAEWKGIMQRQKQRQVDEQRDRDRLTEIYDALGEEFFVSQVEALEGEGNALKLRRQYGVDSPEGFKNWRRGTLTRHMGNMISVNFGGGMPHGSGPLSLYVPAE